MPFAPERPAPPVARSVVLVHGYHVDAQQWNDIVWGKPEKDRLGRVPRAVLIALSQPEPLLLFGTGTAARDGALESQYTLNHARTHRGELHDLVQRTLRTSVERGRRLVDDLLDNHCDCQHSSTNTQTEVAAGMDAALAYSADRLTLVSSPTHIARCLQSALTFLATDARYVQLAGRVSAVASDTTVAGRGPGDVVILEPGTHVANRGAPDFADAARAALPLLGQSPTARAYVHDWIKLTQTWLTRIQKEEQTMPRLTSRCGANLNDTDGAT